jgi:hypothetical protein
LARSITVTRIALILLAATGLFGPAVAGGEVSTIGRLHAAAAGYATPDIALPAQAELERRCGADALCAAELIAAAFGGRAMIEAVDHPDSDSIRLADIRPSLGPPRRLAGGHVIVSLDYFGRRAAHELREAVSGAGAERLILDLRANRGGAFDRMLRVAALFTGPVDEALWLTERGGRRGLAIPAGAERFELAALTVLIGPETASSAEILAALLRRHAGAEIVGQRSFGKDYLLRAIPVHHDWRLLVPAGRIEVPGEIIAGGLAPDRPLASVELPGVEWPGVEWP